MVINEIAASIREEDEQRLANALFELLLSALDHPHQHICGFPIAAERREHDPPASVKGCGFRWAHPQRTEVTRAVYERNHTCPRCGAGPWYMKADVAVELIVPPHAEEIVVVQDLRSMR